MNQKELKELIEFLIEKDITEFELERGDVRVRIKRGSDPSPATVVAVPQLAVSPPVPAATGPNSPPSAAAHGTASAESRIEEADNSLHIVHSPIVGTFYESPSPGSPPFVKVGDSVETGQILCIVEAMKLMNEIEAEVAGEIIKKMVSNGQPIEYGQQLFAIRPT